jgi:O-acetyl-ADP-ribose deacetylase (regulator of RNase III)
MRECAEIMLRETAKHFENPTSIERVCFVLFDTKALAAFEEAFRELQANQPG